MANEQGRAQIYNRVYGYEMWPRVRLPAAPTSFVVWNNTKLRVKFPSVDLMEARTVFVPRVAHPGTGA